MNIDDLINHKLDKAAYAEMARAKGDEMTDCIHNWDLTYSGVEIRCKKCGLVLDDSEVLDRMVMLENDLADMQSQLTARDALIERLVEAGQVMDTLYECDSTFLLSEAYDAHHKWRALVSEWQAMIEQPVEVVEQSPVPELPKVLWRGEVRPDKGLNVRSSRGFVNNVLFVLPKGSYVDVYENNDTWARIDPIESHWVAKRLLKVITDDVVSEWHAMKGGEE